MTTDLGNKLDREERLNAVLLSYMEAMEAGRTPDQRRFLEEHPDLRRELEEFFLGHDEVERLAAPIREACKEGLEDGAPARVLSVFGPIAQNSGPQASVSEGASDLGRLGDFRLVREVGRGGMGVVYEAEQVSLRRRVALKVLPFAGAIDPRQLQRFKNEAMAAANLRHKSIVSVYAVGTESGVHYYAMEFIEGQSVASLIGELRRFAGESDLVPRAACATEGGAAGLHDSSTEPRPQAEDAHRLTAASISKDRRSGRRRYYEWVANVGCQAAMALEHAHQMGIVHRDIKPANLLLDWQGQLWVTDFGLAQVTGGVGLTVTGELLGTLRYASPEQAQARRGVVDHRSDIYSLGATLYELITLHPIFKGRDRHELLRQIACEEPQLPRVAAPSVPADLETIVLKAINKEPSERYATAQDLADDLKRFLDNRTVLARRPTLPARLRKWAQRYPSIVIAAVVFLALACAGSLLSTALIHGEQNRTKAEQEKAEEAFHHERLRADEAEARFRLARRAVDELFCVCEEELANRPGMEWARKRLLTSVLAYYQEFIEQRRDDPQAQAELLGMADRVEKILGDLAALRNAGMLYLLGYPATHDDLRLSDQQRAKVNDLMVRIRKRWMELINDIGRLTPAERGRQYLQQARADEGELNGILSEGQLNRLRQIGLQSEGPRAFYDPEVVTRLQLTAEQRDRIRAIEEEWLFLWMNTAWPGRATSTPGQTHRSDKPVDQRILALLTEEQTLRWKELAGEPFRLFASPVALPTPTLHDAKEPRR